MAALDRLGWAAGAIWIAEGVRFGVRVTEASALSALAARLPPGARPGPKRPVDVLYSLVVGGVGSRPGQRRFHVAYAGSARLHRSLDPEPAVKAIASHLELEAASRSPRTFVHAGVVAIAGGAIVIPGKSRSGKSSLVAALVRAGAVYYSDEFAVIGRDGRVHPYPRPLGLRDAEGISRATPVAALGGVAGTRPLPVRAVVVTRYRPGATPRWRRLTPGETVLALLANAVAARAEPRRTLDALERVARGAAAAMKGARGEAEDAARGILSRTVAIGPTR